VRVRGGRPSESARRVDTGRIPCGANLRFFTGWERCAVSSDHTVHGQTLFVVVMLDGNVAPATSRRGLARMTAAATGLLILVRHGQSTWNLSNQFTGWMDVPLTLGGVNDAQQAGRLLGASGMRIDACYTSGLQRSVQTAQVVCDHLQQQPRYLGRKAIPLLKRYRSTSGTMAPSLVCQSRLCRRECQKRSCKLGARR
jgi:hypothetical protein